MQKSSIFMCLIFKGFSSLQKIIRRPHRAPKCPASTPQTGLSRFVQPTSWEVATAAYMMKFVLAFPGYYFSSLSHERKHKLFI